MSDSRFPVSVFVDRDLGPGRSERFAGEDSVSPDNTLWPYSAPSGDNSGGPHSEWLSCRPLIKDSLKHTEIGGQRGKLAS